MSDDGHLSDRMAAVLAGRARWTADELGHLAACEACRDEFDLLAATRELGSRAPVVDAARIAAAVVPAATAARRRQRWLRVGGWSSAVLAAAAAVALVVLPRMGGVGPAAGPGPVVLAELDGLSSTDLEAVLASVEAGLPDTAATVADELNDLNAAELQAVLEGLEG